MLQLAALYDIIKDRTGLSHLEPRIKNIIEEHKTTCENIGKTYGIGFLKAGRTRNPVKGHKSRK
jgi:hypothetical protein